VCVLSFFLYVFCVKKERKNFKMERRVCCWVSVLLSFLFYFFGLRVCVCVCVCGVFFFKPHAKKRESEKYRPVQKNKKAVVNNYELSCNCPFLLSIFSQQK